MVAWYHGCKVRSICAGKKDKNYQFFIYINLVIIKGTECRNIGNHGQFAYVKRQLANQKPRSGDIFFGLYVKK